ncbi:MAG: nucleotidyltransferase domain-containing protein [Nitrospirota bacterium]|nr:nucleotidyltransferase domain-containing protein [Nitrospirota bacterium]
MRKERFDRICKDYGILAAYIFGSRAEEGAAFLEGKEYEKTEDPLADIDMGVVFLERPLSPKERIRTYGRLYSELNEILSPFTLDLIFLQETGVILQFEAISGLVVYSCDEDRRLEYEEMVIKLYQDWKPDYDRYTKEVLEAISG